MATGTVTPLHDDDARRKARFATLKKAFLDGTITEETPLLLYYEPSDGIVGPSMHRNNIIVMNIRQFEILTYLEMVKVMVMKQILVDEDSL